MGVESKTQTFLQVSVFSTGEISDPVFVTKPSFQSFMARVSKPCFSTPEPIWLFLTLRVTNPCRKNEKKPNNVTKTLNSVLKEGLRNVGMPYKM